MNALTMALMPLALLAVPASAATPTGDQRAATAATQPAEAAPAEACPTKKRKGLGSVLRSARSSGLVSVVAGRAGTDGALVNSVANTAIDVAAAADHMAPREKPKC